MRASTVLFDSVGDMRDARARRDDERIFSYGARGTPTTFALEDAVSELEGAYRTRLFPTGLAAIGMVLLSYLKPGDHVLMSDSVYEPTRNLANSFLEPYRHSQQLLRRGRQRHRGTVPGQHAAGVRRMPRLAGL